MNNEGDSPNQYYAGGPSQKGRPRKRKLPQGSPEDMQVQTMRMASTALGKLIYIFLIFAMRPLRIRYLSEFHNVKPVEVIKNCQSFDYFPHSTWKCAYKKLFYFPSFRLVAKECLYSTPLSFPMIFLIGINLNV